MRKRLVSISLAVILVLGLGLIVAPPYTALAATTLNVPGDYPTIQHAINAANPGDTINVAAGTYTENIRWSSKDLVIQGAGEGVSFIRSAGGHGIAINTDYLTRAARLDGFTITGNSQSDGGGMYNRTASSPTISNCTFTGCSAWHLGAAMVNWTGDSAPLIINCTFTNNYCRKGGAMANYWGSSPTVINCTFYDNYAWEYGGAMYNMGSPEIINCTFSNNYAGYDGSGIFNHGGSPTFTNCIVSGNTRRGMFNDYSSSPTVTNCTFLNNAAGGVYNYRDVSLTMSNSILRGHMPVYTHPSSVDTVTYCDVQGGWPGTGNIDADPLLDGTFHLLEGSPCIDTGTNTGAPADDFEGEPRPWDGDGDGDRVVDMGADEFVHQIEEFSIFEMVIDFDEQPNLDEIDMKAIIHLHPDAYYDLSVDDVTVNIDGLDITIPAGSFTKSGNNEKYHFESTKGVEPKVNMKLDFDNGELDLKVDKVDASIVDNFRDVLVTIYIGPMQAEEDIDMWIDSLSYEAVP
ncbi:right-handed parallel beta-helix repeat-containing protein [Chloroflexota bacterium]